MTCPKRYAPLAPRCLTGGGPQKKVSGFLHQLASNRVPDNSPGWAQMAQMAQNHSKIEITCFWPSFQEVSRPLYHVVADFRKTRGTRWTIRLWVGAALFSEIWRSTVASQNRVFLGDTPCSNVPRFQPKCPKRPKTAPKWIPPEKCDSKLVPP